MNKPIIGIVANKEYISKGIYKKSVYDVNDDYIRMITNYDGIPIIIPYINNFKELESFLTTIDALLLIGGEDISPKCFNNNKSENPRDTFEIKIYNFFKKNKKPILGICRGLQIINVAEGGTIKNINNSIINHFIEDDGWINYHSIKIMSNTRLFKIIQSGEYTTSSVHHQQIDKLGKNLIISATSSDGVIEAIESKNNEYIVAFQGHIEKCLDNYNKYANVIKEFIMEASNGK